MMISTCSEDDASVLYDHRDDATDEDKSALTATCMIITRREKRHFKVWVLWQEAEKYWG
jgi:hypothetical protein